MSESKTPRYTLTSGAIVATYNTFDGAPVGDWVRWDDFAAAQSENARLAQSNAELRAALRIIAGFEQCIDNTLGNVEIARRALSREGE